MQLQWRIIGRKEDNIILLLLSSSNRQQNKEKTMWTYNEDGTYTFGTGNTVDYPNDYFLTIYPYYPWYYPKSTKIVIEGEIEELIPLLKVLKGRIRIEVEKVE